ncbi:protein-disulfide reductase DsbD domain-containing protein [Flexibacterium corallicola]|uniref:protein-disulfide reductase DsbD domain-containing protein n=1 Tax=Flexibacterium corallicola TaxID=3037259 RepID=UPI00286F1C20|nr:protein-disulfide reductase DsbD domain-containing protein [Pseudovibrio sp. M1P-2-3]
MNFEGGSVRLVRASAPEESGDYLAGLQFKIKEGWHIYWRYPGEVGLPTQADFTNSTNLKDAKIYYPPPQTYFDGYSTSLVYKKEAFLPIRIERKNSYRPTLLNSSVNFGICSKVCVPAFANLSTVLPSTSTRDMKHDQLFYEALDKIPKPLGKEISRLISTQIEGSGTNKLLLIKATVPQGETTPELFVEGPPMSYHGIPKLLEVKNNIATWSLPLTGFPQQKEKVEVRFTFSFEHSAFEMSKKIQMNPS